jgi:hypothetical protein
VNVAEGVAVMYNGYFTLPMIPFTLHSRQALISAGCKAIEEG